MSSKKALAIICVFAVTLAFTCVVFASDTTSDTMPPLPVDRQAIYERIYKLAFLPDGYPGKMVDGVASPHPIYGPYIIHDYLRQYKKTDEPRYLEAAEKVANAAIARMDEFEGALVFWYQPNTGISSFPEKFYSGLTQSRYLVELALLAQVSGQQKYSAACERVLDSLFIPSERGGVLIESQDGVCIEELPHKPFGYILNGWLTSAVNIKKYADLTGSTRAQDLFDRNMQKLAQLLPLYDVPDLANTRYQLRGFVWLRLRFSHPVDAEITSAKVVIPNDGSHPVNLRGKYRWKNYFLAGGSPGKDGSYVINDQIVQFNVVLSMISYPDPNRIELTIESENEADMRVLIAQGHYDPTLSAMPTESWIGIEEFSIRPGKNEISVAIPWARAELVAYPTNFIKKYGDKRYNVYHFIHVNHLSRLYEITGREVFREYADRWRSYIKRWPDMLIDAGAEVMLTPMPAYPDQ